MTEIIDLQAFKQQRLDAPTPAPKPGDKTWYTPEVFRLTGYEFTLARGDEASFPIASDRPAPVDYTLYNKDTDKMAQPKWEHIRMLDPKQDRGWVVVRHHENADRAYAYAMGQIDTLLCSEVPTCTMFSTEFGIFSLTHFPKVPKGAPNHLLIYIRTRPETDAEELVETLSNDDQYLIYHPDGSKTRNPNILYPKYKDK